jgi:hypothetical protein
MWDDEVNSKGQRKSLLAAGVLLLLFLLAGVFFLFPFGLAGQPELAFSKRQPSIVASRMYVNPGQVIGLQGDSSGFWRVLSRGEGVTITRFNLAGEPQLVEEYPLSNPLVNSNGRMLIMADRDTGQIFLLEGSSGTIQNLSVPGKPQCVAVAETGQSLVVYLPEDGESNSLQPTLAYYNRDGALLFKTLVENGLPVAAQLTQSGNQLFLLLGKISSQGMENHLISYADSGQLLWTAQLPPGPPIILRSKPFGDRVVVAVDKTIYYYNGRGQLLWQHAAQGTIQDVVFLGMGDQIAYSSEKVSVLSFQRRALLTAISPEGETAWQYQLKGSVPRLAGGISSLSLFVANDQGVHSVGPDGTARWSHPMAKADPAGVDLTASEDGSRVLVQGADGRMFVLRGE